MESFEPVVLFSALVVPALAQVVEFLQVEMEVEIEAQAQALLVHHAWDTIDSGLDCDLFAPVHDVDLGLDLALGFGLDLCLDLRLDLRLHPDPQTRVRAAV